MLSELYERLWWWKIRREARGRLDALGPDALSRRVSVENYLMNCYAGKNPLPDKEKCRQLAIKLGTPSKRGVK